MYYSSGNYEAFVHPRKPEGLERKSAYTVGTALAALTAVRTAPPKRRELPVPPLPEADCTAEAPRLTISVTRLEQLSPALLELGRPARVYVPLEEVSRLEGLPGEGPEWCAVLPRVWRDRDEPALRTLLERARALGFTGVLTFKNARKALEVVENVPLHRIVLETDCPYMAPEPYRGKRCDSTMLPRMAEKLAQLRDKTVEEIEQITWENGCRLFRLNP